MGVYGGPNVVSFCSGAGRWCWTVCSGGEGVLAVCGTMALVGTVVRVGGGGGCARPTRDGVVRCGAPRGVDGLWGPAELGRGGDAAGGVAAVLGHQGVGVGGGGGVVIVLVVPRPLALREWWSWYGVDVCGRWSLAGLPG